MADLIVIFSIMYTIGLSDFRRSDFGVILKKLRLSYNICQSTRNDLKSTNLKSELKNLYAILRKIAFCVSKIDFLGRIYENTFLTPERLN